MKKRIYRQLTVLLAVVCLLCGCDRKDSIYVTNAEGELLTEQSEENTLFMGAEAEATSEESKELQTEEKEDDIVSEDACLLVHICGAVQSPGVYELTEGDRICHAVEMAGGFTKEADEDYLNQALKLTDGMRIYIPTEEETAKTADLMQGSADSLFITENSLRKETDEDLVNINTASLEQLCTLPGIGEGKAQNIIAYRTKEGSYESIEEIMNVEGIKEGLFEKIRDRITVS